MRTAAIIKIENGWRVVCMDNGEVEKTLDLFDYSYSYVKEVAENWANGIIKSEVKKEEVDMLYIENADEAKDRIMIENLTECAHNLVDNIHRSIADSIDENANIVPYIAQDVQDSIDALNAINKVLEYFGGDFVSWTGYARG